MSSRERDCRPLGGGLCQLDRTLGTPEANLALDEAILRQCEAALARGELPQNAEALRFWESPTYFVTLGVSGKLQEELHVETCRREGVPVLRRASGGGTVLQGPGCLNFALVLAFEPRPELRDVTRSYAAILSRIAGSLKGGAVGEVGHRGTSDLTLGNLKISGNAQKRSRHALLHHGTILHDFDLTQIPRFLQEPEKQPEYRHSRRHEDFVRNLDLPVKEIKSRIARAWGAVSPAATHELPDVSGLIADKYANRAWTEKF
jgi:lipoate-protein ligase A